MAQVAVMDFPLAATMSGQTRAILVTMPPSNYVEKARWVLQLAKIPFEELKYAPVLHRFATKPKGGSSVPLLYWPTTKQSLTDSSAILDLCAQSLPSLYPTTETKELERYYDESLGPHARRTAYFMAFSDDSMGRKIVLGALAGWGYALAWLFYPLMRVFLRKAMEINESATEVSLTKVEQMAGEAQERLGDGPIGSRFLAGDTFSAADITFCAYMSLLMAPPEHVYLRDVDLNKFKHPMRERIQRLQASKIGQYVYWCYHTHRPAMCP